MLDPRSRRATARPDDPLTPGPGHVAAPMGLKIRHRGRISAAMCRYGPLGEGLRQRIVPGSVVSGIGVRVGCAPKISRAGGCDGPTPCARVRRRVLRPCAITRSAKRSATARVRPARCRRVISPPASPVGQSGTSSTCSRTTAVPPGARSGSTAVGLGIPGDRRGDAGSTPSSAWRTDATVRDAAAQIDCASAVESRVREVGPPRQRQIDLEDTRAGIDTGMPACASPRGCQAPEPTGARTTDRAWCWRRHPLAR